MDPVAEGEMFDLPRAYAGIPCAGMPIDILAERERWIADLGGLVRELFPPEQ